jgi:hypothetical protein
MSNIEDKNNIRDERIEDITMYGEFISSFHNWITPDRQRKNARRLGKVTGEIYTNGDDDIKTDKKRSN